MLKTLVNKQITEIFRSYFYNPKTNKKRSKLATFGFIAFFVFLIIGIFGGIFGALAYSLSGVFSAVNMTWLYFTIFVLISVALGIFGSVFNTFTGLYLSKDNDLLLSMPISPSLVIASRLIAVYIMGAIYSVPIILSAVIVHFVINPFSFATLVGSLVSVVLVTLFVLNLSCLLGFVVAKISLKLKNKSFLTVFIAIAFFAIYYFVYFKAGELIPSLIENVLIYGNAVKGKAYPLYVIGRACEGDALSLLLVSLSVLILLALTWLLLSKTFLKISTASSSDGKKSSLKKSSIRQKSVFSSLVSKEFSRFASSPSYMLNCGLGVLFLPVVAIIFAVKSSSITALMTELGLNSAAISVAIIAILCLTSTMIDISAPSVSLEGKTVWILKSLPLDAKYIMNAKLLVQLIVSLAAVGVSSLILAIALPVSIIYKLFIVILPLIFATFYSVFCTLISIKMPIMNWTNEMTPIKQSAGVMVSLFSGFGFALVVGVPYFFVMNKLNGILYLSAALLLLAAAAAFMYYRLMKISQRKFSEL